MQNKEIFDFVLDKIDDLKARDVMTFDVSSFSSITDNMVICSGTSKKHVQSIAEHLIVEAKAADEAPLGVEGMDTGEWVLVDMGSTVLHIMQEGTRDFYQLEKLWQSSIDNAATDE